MKLSLDDLQVTSFSTAEVAPVSVAPATGPEGPYSYCWICRPTDPGVPSCDFTCAVDSHCQCYA
jgi:hypothetical protein